jgi:hypothetical protein
VSALRFKVVLVAVAAGGLVCATAFPGPNETARIKMQLSKKFPIGAQLYGPLRLVVVVCFKLLMGVPWHAFPPEALLVRRIIEDLLLVSEKHAVSVDSVEDVSFPNAD